MSTVSHQLERSYFTRSLLAFACYLLIGEFSEPLATGAAVLAACAPLPTAAPPEPEEEEEFFVFFDQ